MPVPKKKTTKSARNQRRSHHGLKKPVLSKCSNCQQPVRPHYVCLQCGHYKGKKIIEIKTKDDKKLNKQSQKSDKKDQKKIQQDENSTSNKRQ